MTETTDPIVAVVDMCKMIEEHARFLRSNQQGLQALLSTPAGRANLLKQRQTLVAASAAFRQAANAIDPCVKHIDRGLKKTKRWGVAA